MHGQTSPGQHSPARTGHLADMGAAGIMMDAPSSLPHVPAYVARNDRADTAAFAARGSLDVLAPPDRALLPVIASMRMLLATGHPR